MRPYIDESACVGCGGCEVVCPVEPCVFAVDDKSRVVHPEACAACGTCAQECPANAITLREE